MSITLTLFGGARLADASGAPCDGRAGRRRLALLAILGVQRGEPIARERIVSLLWPDVPTAQGRRSLAESLHVIQKELGEDPVVRRGDELALDLDRVRCDVVEFEHAIEEGRFEEAVSLYAGPFLAGLVVRDAPDFSFWADRTRERLQDAFAAATERAAAGAEARGAWAEAVAAWRRLSAEVPESTPVALRLAGALDGAGDRAAALRHLQFHAAYLREVLELEAPEELQVREAELREPRQLEAPADVPVQAPHAPVLIRHSGDDSPESDDETDTDDDRQARIEPVAATGQRLEGTRDRAVPPPASSAVRRGARYRLAAAAGVALAALGIGYAAWTRTPSASAAAEPPVVRVAIADCVTNGADPELAGLCGGLMDLLTVELSGIESFAVLRPLSRPGGTSQAAVHPDTLAARWNADAVLAGSLERSGGRVRHTLLLTDARSGGRVLADTLEVPAGESFALEENLARRAAALFRRHTGRRLALEALEAGSGNGEARRLVMRAYAEHGRALQELSGSDAVMQAVGVRRLARVDTLLMRAEQGEPGWAAPTLLRGWSTWSRAKHVDDDAGTALLSLARAHADRSIARSPRDPRAWELRALVLWDMANRPEHRDSMEALVDAAARDASAAVDVDEYRVSAWTTLSQMQRMQGKHAEAYYSAVRAREMDHFLERDRTVTLRLFRAALAFGRFDLAARHCADGGRDHPEFWRFAECPLTLLAHTDTGSVDTVAAAAVLRRLNARDPPEMLAQNGRGYARVHRHMLYAAVLARAGATDRVHAEVATARAFLSPRDARSFQYDEAHVRLALGDTTGAKRVLDEYLAQHPMDRRLVAAEYLFRGLVP